MMKKARSDKKISQKELAEILNLNQSYISRIENKKNKSITVQMVVDISNALDINPVDLFLYFAEISAKGK